MGDVTIVALRRRISYANLLKLITIFLKLIIARTKQVHMYVERHKFALFYWHVKMLRDGFQWVTNEKDIIMMSQLSL